MGSLMESDWPSGFPNVNINQLEEYARTFYGVPHALVPMIIGSGAGALLYGNVCAGDRPGNSGNYSRIHVGGYINKNIMAGEGGLRESRIIRTVKLMGHCSHA
jgi:hypothetical protein